MSGSWISTPAEKYGGGLISERPGAAPEAGQLTSVAGPRTQPRYGVLDPSAPLFWFAVVAAASVGLMAYSTTARVGPISAELNVGKT